MIIIQNQDSNKSADAGSAGNSGASAMAGKIAMMRACESCKPEDERICYDPYAIRFLDPGAQKYVLQSPESARAILAQIDGLMPGLAGSVVARVRYFDDVARASVDKGFRQIVILGAGYDTRAYRIHELKTIRVFEVDRPETISAKSGIIREIFGSLPGHVTYVSVNFDKEGPGRQLAAGGYDPSQKTLFIMEGLLMYLSPESVDGTLAFVVNNSGKGSAVLFDHSPANTGNPADSGWKEGMDVTSFVQQQGEPLKFGVKGPVETFLKERGFTGIRNMGSEDYRKEYFTGKNRDRAVLNLLSFAYAVVGSADSVPEGAAPGERKGPNRLAERMAMIRAGESRRPEGERICYDPYAIRFIGPEFMKLMSLDPAQRDAVIAKLESGMPGLTNSVLARVRFFDDVVQSSLDGGLEQLVILGAGYDARAYRIEGLKNVRVFEVDHPDTMSVKMEKIKDIFGSLPGHVSYVSTDLEIGNLRARLAECGYDQAKKTLFIMEGLLVYLAAPAVDDILSFILHSSGRGSFVAFDYGRVRTGTAPAGELEASKSVGRFVKNEGDSVKFGMIGPVEDFLGSRGFSHVRNMTDADYKKAYFTGKNAGRQVSSLLWFASAVVG
ncbi:MAG TPA: class I SAM-dependent methyltransferase [Methanocella sp.]|jgi:methyltransferase (TIGR00027 family)